MVLTQPIVPTLSDALLPVLLVALVVYLAPSVVALAVNHKRSLRVLAINLLLGWTLIAWALSLRMALDRRRSTRLAGHGDAPRRSASPATPFDRRSLASGPRKRP